MIATRRETTLGFQSTNARDYRGRKNQPSAVSKEWENLTGVRIVLVYQV